MLRLPPGRGAHAQLASERPRKSAGARIIESGRDLCYADVGIAQELLSDLEARFIDEFVKSRFLICKSTRHRSRTEAEQVRDEPVVDWLQAYEIGKNASNLVRHRHADAFAGFGLNRLQEFVERRRCPGNRRVQKRRRKLDHGVI